MKVVSTVDLGLSQSGIKEGYITKIDDNLFKFTSNSFKQLIKKSEYERILHLAKTNPGVDVESEIKEEKPAADVTQQKTDDENVDLRKLNKEQLIKIAIEYYEEVDPKLTRKDLIKAILEAREG